MTELVILKNIYHAKLVIHITLKLKIELVIFTMILLILKILIQAY